MTPIERALDDAGRGNGVAPEVLARTELAAALARALGLGLAREDLRSLLEELITEEEGRVVEEGEGREC